MILGKVCGTVAELEGEYRRPREPKAVLGPQQQRPLAREEEASGVMGEVGHTPQEIAQVIANAEIPVVVKDIEQKFVDAALEKAQGRPAVNVGPQ